MKGDPGDDGHTPTDEELVALILPLIPPPVKGDDGLTPTKSELLKLIRPLIPEVQDGETPTDERLLSLIGPLIPVIEPLPQRNFIEEIRAMSNEEATEFSKVIGPKIDISHIRNANSFMYKGTRYQIAELMHGAGSGGSSTPTTIPVYNEVVAGSGTSWTLTHVPTTGSVELYANGQRLTPTIDFSISGTAITTVLSWSAGTVLADYTYAGSGTTSTPVDNEVVSGSGTAWTLAATPTLGSVQLFANGQRLTPTVDYSITGAAITTVLSWAAGTVLADYTT